MAALSSANYFARDLNGEGDFRHAQIAADAALARVAKQTSPNHNLAGAAFGLWTGGLRETFTALEATSLDSTAMATDHIDRLTRPAANRTRLYEKIVDA